VRDFIDRLGMIVTYGVDDPATASAAVYNIGYYAKVNYEGDGAARMPLLQQILQDQAGGDM
jgi:hypothetical protein